MVCMLVQTACWHRHAAQRRSVLHMAAPPDTTMQSCVTTPSQQLASTGHRLCSCGSMCADGATICLLLMNVMKQKYGHLKAQIFPKKIMVQYANSAWRTLPSASNDIRSRVVSTPTANKHTSCSYVTNMETCKGTTKSSR